MKLIDALQIVNAPQEGAPFEALLACGCEPLHLATAVTAHLRMVLPGRTVTLRTGLYGDLAGTLETTPRRADAVFVVLEWSDLDPRLGWRSTSSVAAHVVADARAQLARIGTAIAAWSEAAPVALSLPALPLPPVFHRHGRELDRIEAALRESVYALAASTPAVVLRPDGLGGEESLHDVRTELTSGFPYRFAYADRLAAEMVRAACPIAPKKGLITDLDETLWRGILGDDGPDALSWDLEHKTHFHGLYQRLLNVLARSGVLIGVASKNDAALVREAFARPDLVVDPRHLFPIEAHWDSKSQSVERILTAWNIAPDSVVFVDDNALELAEVQAAFPSMACCQFRADTAFLEDLRDRFARRTVGEEDTLRVDSVRSGSLVRRLAGDGSGLEALLAGARASLTFRWNEQPPDPRALELINKTNQFTLNGARFTEAEWKRYVSDPSTHVVVVEYEDRFGRLGKIAVIAGREVTGGFDVEVWAMSCRAFSRRIEHQCLKVLLDRWERVTFHWKYGQRNGPMLAFLTEMAPDRRSIRRAAFARRCPPLFHDTSVVGEAAMERSA